MGMLQLIQQALQQAQPQYQNSDWYKKAVAFKDSYGRQAFEQAWKNGQLGDAAPPDEGASQFLSGQLAQWQDNGDSPFGIDELNDISPALAFFGATTGLGGMTGAQAATGGDIGSGVTADLAGLGAGAGLAQALPALGLSTVAPTAAAGAAPATLADTLAANAAGGLRVAPEAASLGSAISGASGATGASGVIPGLATESAGALGGGLSVPGVTGFGSTGAIGAAGAGLGAGLGATLGSAAAGSTVPAAVGGGLGTGTAAAAAGAGGAGATKLGDILSGNVGLDDLANNLTLGDLGRTLGTGLATAGSIYADTQRANAQKEMYNTYLGLGAPSRARYEASFAPGFDVNSIPGFTNALDTTANSVLRKLSTSGNPFGNPGQLTEAMNYISGNLALPALNNYRNQNAATGGFGAFSTAAPGVGAAAIDSGSAAYSDLARGASDIFNPPTDLATILRKYQQGGGASARGLT